MESNIVLVDLVDTKKDFLFYESMCRLRANLQALGEDLKVILFTSAIPKEGVMDISFQVAASMANIERKVLYIDASISNSIFANKYQTDDKFNGISQFLRGEVECSEIIHKTNINNLDMVFAGPSVTNSTELLYKSCLDKFISEQRKCYDYIIISSPPLFSTVDAAVLGRFVDGAVIVIKSGKVSRKLVNSAKLQLEKVCCKVVGVVLSSAKINSKYYRKRK